MIKILHIFGKMNCGGAETMLLNIYRNIDRSRFKFSFLVHSEGIGYFDEEIKNLGGDIFFLESQGTQGLRKYIKSLQKFLEENPVDIVHSHLDWQGGAIAKAAFKARIKRRIVHVHTKEDPNLSFSRQLVISLEKKWINKYATDFWGCSEEACEYLFNKNKKTRIITNAIELNKYLNPDKNRVRELRKEFESSLIIGHIGSFSKNKNQIFLIELAKDLREKEIDFNLLLIGNYETDYGNDCIKLVKAYKLELNVHFLGLCDDIYNLVQVFDVFCFPSYFEGLGMAIVEAQAGGVFCLISDNIPKSADLKLGLIKNLPLNEKKLWLQEILNENNRRLILDEEMQKNISCSKFNIVKNIKYIENLYNGEINKLDYTN